MELLKIGSKPLVTPRTMRFNKITLAGLGKDYMYDIVDLMYGEHEKYNE